MKSEELVQTLDDFANNPSDHLRKIRESGCPEVLTAEGRPAAVVLDIDTYRRFQALIDRAESIAAIAEAIASMNRGEEQPAEEVFAAWEAKYSAVLDG